VKEFVKFIADKKPGANNMDEPFMIQMPDTNAMSGKENIS